MEKGFSLFAAVEEGLFRVGGEGGVFKDVLVELVSEVVSY